MAHESDKRPATVLYGPGMTGFVVTLCQRRRVAEPRRPGVNELSAVLQGEVLWNIVEHVTRQSVSDTVVIRHVCSTAFGMINTLFLHLPSVL